jgi:hypothetical protein
MTKIVYNACFGGFSISAGAVRLGKVLAPDDVHWTEVCEEYGMFEGPRHDQTLVRVVEELGDDANGMCAKLRVAAVPSGALYRIDEYDGRESIKTNDTYDWTVAP